MRLVLHPEVSSDISKIMEFYEQVATSELADEFYRELRHFIQEAAERPESFAIRERDIRRASFSCARLLSGIQLLFRVLLGLLPK
jgi:plasmid stabilization system protein ParE